MHIIDRRTGRCRVVGSWSVRAKAPAGRAANAPASWSAVALHRFGRSPTANEHPKNCGAPSFFILHLKIGGFKVIQGYSKLNFFSPCPEISRLTPESFRPRCPCQSVFVRVSPSQPNKIMNLTRNGKIARLPQPLREDLNRRLNQGAQGRPLLQWLNSLPEVQAVLAADFGGRPINKQSLSQWRRGGYAEWLRQQETWVLAGPMTAETRASPSAAPSPSTGYSAGLCRSAPASAPVRPGQTFEILKFPRDPREGGKKSPPSWPRISVFGFLSDFGLRPSDFPPESDPVRPSQTFEILKNARNGRYCPAAQPLRRMHKKMQRQHPMPLFLHSSFSIFPFKQGIQFMTSL